VNDILSASRIAGQQAHVPIFSITGQWIAFVTPDCRVWRPDSNLLGHIVDGNVYSVSGEYVGTLSNGVMSRLADRSGTKCPLPDSPVLVPGYPGIPEPSLIRPLAPGETLQEKLLFR